MQRKNFLVIITTLHWSPLFVSLHSLLTLLLFLIMDEKEVFSCLLESKAWRRDICFQQIIFISMGLLIFMVRNFVFFFPKSFLKMWMIVHKSLRKQVILAGHLLFKLKANKIAEYILLLKNRPSVNQSAS